MRKPFIIVMVLIAAMAVVNCGGGGGGGGALAPVGPVDPQNGFPTYYSDANGLALALCKDPLNLLCIADPVVGGNPFSAQTGFGARPSGGTQTPR